MVKILRVTVWLENNTVCFNKNKLMFMMKNGVEDEQL